MGPNANAGNAELVGDVTTGDVVAIGLKHFSEDCGINILCRCFTVRHEGIVCHISCWLPRCFFHFC